MQTVTAVSRPLAPDRALPHGWTVRLGLAIMKLCCRQARGRVVMFRKEIKEFHFHIFFKKTKIFFVKSVDVFFR